MKEILIGIGSNLGDRHQNIRDALDLLDFVEDLRCSAIHDTKAVLKDGAPKQWDKDFLNVVVYGKTTYTPVQILKRLKLIEEHLGRDPSSINWSPRIIDLDLLLCDDCVVNFDNLKLPHPEMLKREFVMKPALEVAPHMVHPLVGKKLVEIWKG
ncbi:MAG: 2-amino-4-hydroxy-6-hydroxymethyldihydropteridine diphosphokinase [Rickettsiales bacterium]